MPKLYWATDRESCEWVGPNESVDDCKREARESLLGLDAIWVAPVDPDTDDDDRFWLRVADLFLHECDAVDESLSEDGWLDPEERWLHWPIEDRNGDVARALRATLPPRPDWRMVDTAKAERVEL